MGGLTASESEQARLQLARISVGEGQSLHRALGRLAQLAADTIRVARVSIWLLIDKGRAIQCHYLYQPDCKDVFEGVVLLQSDFPHYFEALNTSRVISVMDVDGDPMTAEFRDSYFKPLGISSMLDAPIFQGGQLVGIVCHEHIGPVRSWTDSERNFAACVADALARLFEEAARLKVEDSLGVFQQHVQELEHIGALGRLAAEIAHDFNNVLTAINAYTDMIHRSADDNVHVSKLVQGLSKAVERGTNLTQELLTYGRGKPSNPRVVDMGATLSSMREMLQMSAGKDIQLNLTVHGPVSRVFIDPALLERAMLNLVVNARDAMPQGGSIHVDVREAILKRSDDVEEVYVLLDIRDTGQGMDAQTRERIFEPFFTTKGERGTGLGLAIVNQFMSLSGGFVEVDSQPGEGTVIRIYLPRIAGPT